tara:strand:- start:531 stop:1178 length:648 start_codon:yes stop_codon:yes gene_type:complete
MTNPNTRDSFIFYRSFYEAINHLPEDQQLQIYKAISSYSLDFKEVNLKGISNAIFTLIKPQLEANKKRYLNGIKGAEHGVKGGKPKTPNKPQTNPKLTPNVNVNVNPNGECKLINENKNIILPNFIKDNLWSEFLAMRKKLKAPNTEMALNRILKKLKAFEQQNIGNGTLAIENSIENGWKGVFEPKATHFNKNNSNNSFDAVFKEIESDQFKLK